ncbi:MAG: hypothetical protein ABEI86_01760, partial [Halobacteriaceae archaeon]
LGEHPSSSSYSPVMFVSKGFNKAALTEYELISTNSLARVFMITLVRLIGTKKRVRLQKPVRIPMPGELDPSPTANFRHNGTA